MNTQDILRKGGIWLDIALDFSEFYDFELVQPITLNQIDAELDFSEFYDFELVQPITLTQIDLILDYSEFYDYTLGDSVIDYIYYEKIEPVCVFHFLLTEDGCVMDTENNCGIEYEFNGNL
jgi:hypothetical protein